MTDTEIWEAALIKAGVWKQNDPLFSDTPLAGFITAPTIGDAEATMRMLEWLVVTSRVVMSFYTDSSGKIFAQGEIYGRYADTLPLAIVAAVCAVKGE